MAQVQWLVDIPPEIRLKIYEEYCKSLTVKVCKTTSHLISAGPAANQVAVNEPIAILLTSKTVRAEAIQIFLKFVTFTISEICCVDPISPNFRISDAFLRAKHVVWEGNCYHPASRYESRICIAYHLRKLRRLGGLKIEHLRKTLPISIFSTDILSSMLSLVPSSISALQFWVAATDFLSGEVASEGDKISQDQRRIGP